MRDDGVVVSWSDLPVGSLLAFVPRDLVLRSTLSMNVLRIFIGVDALGTPWGLTPPTFDNTLRLANEWNYRMLSLP